MKNIILGSLIAVGAFSVALAQDDAPPARDPAAAAAATEAACASVTAYGVAQPSGTVQAAADAPAAAAPGRAGRRGGAGRGEPGAAQLAVIARMQTRKVSIPTAPMINYAPVDAPQAPAGTQFGNIASVALLSNGHVIVYQRTSLNELLEYDADNHLLRTFNNNIAARPHNMRVDKHDNIWITDVTCNTVMKLSPTGDVLMTLGTKGKTGTWNEATGDHLFNQPTDVDFGPTGDIFISTGHGGPDPRIVRFDKNGKFITTWSLKHADGTSANIHTMVVDKSGLVYAGDREVKMIYVYDKNGKHIRDMHTDNLVCGLFIDAKGGLWMTAGQDGMIQHIDWQTGKVLGWTGKIGKGPNEYGEAHYMAITPDLKTIYVADTVNNDVQKLVAN